MACYLYEARRWGQQTDSQFDLLPPGKEQEGRDPVGGDKQRCDKTQYNNTAAEQVQLDAFLEENLSSGRIRPSKSPFASPFFFVKKKDGTLRPVQDYCKLNEMTIKNC